MKNGSEIKAYRNIPGVGMRLYVEFEVDASRNTSVMPETKTHIERDRRTDREVDKETHSYALSTDASVGVSTRAIVDKEMLRNKMTSEGNVLQIPQESHSFLHTVLC